MNKDEVELRIQEDELEYAQKKFLLKHGWAYSSNNFACLWLYEKQIGGKTFVCDRDLALRLEQHWNNPTRVDEGNFEELD